MRCKHCGAEHHLLEALTPECLAGYVMASAEQIDETLNRGWREAEAFLEVDAVRAGGRNQWH